MCLVAVQFTAAEKDKLKNLQNRTCIPQLPLIRSSWGGREKLICLPPGSIGIIHPVVPSCQCWGYPPCAPPPWLSTLWQCWDYPPCAPPPPWLSTCGSSPLPWHLVAPLPWCWGYPLCGSLIWRFECCVLLDSFGRPAGQGHSLLTLSWVGGHHLCLCIQCALHGRRGKCE